MVSVQCVVLQVLDLTGNCLTVLGRLPAGASLTSLHLAGNRINSVERCALCHATALQLLDLSRNRLVSLGGALAGPAPTITSLALSANPLSEQEVAGLLRLLPGLQNLQLARLQLARLPPDLLIQNRELHHLNLSTNLLARLPPAALRRLSHLVTLDLSSNLLAGVEAELVSAWAELPGLAEVLLAGNPWQCDTCHVGELEVWLRGRQHRCTPRDCAVCRGPPTLAGQPVSSLAGSLTGCNRSSPSSRHTTTATVSRLWHFLAAGLSLALLLAALAGLAARYTHYGVYLTGEREDAESSALTDPVSLLERVAGVEKESYVDLHYLTISGNHTDSCSERWH